MLSPRSGVEEARRLIDGARDVEPIDLWPEPDMGVVKEGRRDPPILPLAVFGPFWKEWVASAAEGANAPLDYVATALLPVAAMLIGNARWVRPWGDWKEPPVLWCGVVGDPSSSKSPGIDPVLDLVRVLETEIAADFDTTHRQWLTAREMARAELDKWKGEVKDAAKAGKAAPTMPAEAVEPVEPVRPRIIVSDSTPEKLGELAAAHPKGLLFFRDELSGWFGAFDRYSGNGAERALWLESYGGRSYVIDRIKSAKPIAIKHLAIGILGGIQPDKLTELLSGPEDGLPARFLWSWPDPISPERPQRSSNRAEALAALRRLSTLSMGADDLGGAQPRLLPLSDDAAATFHEWRQSHHREAVTLTGPLAAAWGKAPGQLLRLALVLEHLWWCALRAEEPPPEKISRLAINSAAGLLEGYFKPMAGRVYGDASLSERDRLAATLSRWILKERPALINARKLRREARLLGLKETDKINLALDALTEADWLRAAPAREGDTLGRQRRDFIVNPRVAGRTDA